MAVLEATEIELRQEASPEVFQRGVGEGTEIVQKEMYTFLDRSTPPHSLTLRPEGTAGAPVLTLRISSADAAAVELTTPTLKF